MSDMILIGNHAEWRLVAELVAQVLTRRTLAEGSDLSRWCQGGGAPFSPIANRATCGDALPPDGHAPPHPLRDRISTTHS